MKLVLWRACGEEEGERESSESLADASRLLEAQQWGMHYIRWSAEAPKRMLGVAGGGSVRDGDAAEEL